MKRPFTMLAAIAVLGTTAAPAYADDSLRVSYRDLDLTTAKGQETLDRRIDSAARKYCGLGQLTGTRLASPQARQCYAETMKQAKAQFAAIVEAKRLGG